jgi:hypothetical protein
MTTNHRVIATAWQLQAAQQGRLGAMIVPMVPPPILCDTADCYVSRGKEWSWITATAHAIWGENDPISELLLRRLPYQVGDRLYLAEPWVQCWNTETLDWTYFTESTTPEAEHIVWQPATSMPPEASQYWYEVTGVTGVQMSAITPELQCTSGLIRGLPRGEMTNEQRESFSNAAKGAAMDKWNAAHPEYPWSPERWVVVIEVSKAKDPYC